MMDTPTYEKDGWTGDTQLAAPIASLLFDPSASGRSPSESTDMVDGQSAS